MTDPRPTPVTIAYTSHYGGTARLAHALADRLGARAVDLADLADSGAPAGATLVVFAPIYASRPRARKRVLAAVRAATGPVAVGLVGISPLDDDERLATADRLRSDAVGPRPLEVFHLRGVYDPARLGLLHRMMMLAAKRGMRGSDDPASRAILAGERIDLSDEAALDPIVRWVRDRAR